MEYYFDSHDPLNSINNPQLKNEIITNLDRGITSHLILPEDFSKLKKSELEKIYELSYVPITLILEKDKILNKNEDITNIIEILKVIISKILKTTIYEIEILERENFYVFNPLTVYGTSVFENSQYISEFYEKIKIEEFVGYTLLSSSPLTRFIVDKWVKEGEYLLHELGIKYFPIQQEQVSLIPYDKIEFIQRLDNFVSKLTKEGYFSYIFGVFDLDDIEIIRELCLLYDIEIIDTKDISTFILKTSVDFKTSPEEWLRYNLPIVKAGFFPVFSISGDWLYSYDDEYRRKYSFAFKDAVLKYVAYLSFARLSDEHPFIRPFTSLININEDLTIQVSLPSYKLVQQFKKYFEEILKNFYSIVVCKNLKEGIIKRWLIQSIDNDAYPMIFLDKTGNEVLVHRSPLAIQFPSPFDFSEEDMIRGEKELLEKLREYYTKVKVCHDNIEPVTLEEINGMNLEELLNLIPITENGITYCFSNETISKIDTNPLTRRPLSEKTLSRIKYLEFGLRGGFDIGILYGLYEDVPTKINIPPRVDGVTGIIGITRITRISVDPKSRELLGNLFLVEILFSDETTTSLFEISLPTIELEKIDELNFYVEKLWEKGYFFNYWYSAVNKYLDLSSFSILITDPILIHAGRSIFDGNLALNHLKNIFLEK